MVFDVRDTTARLSNKQEQQTPFSHTIVDHLKGMSNSLSAKDQQTKWFINISFIWSILVIMILFKYLDDIEMYLLE